MSIKISDFHMLANARELERRHPDGIYFAKTVLSEVELTPSGVIRISYDVDLRDEGFLLLEKVMKTHLAKVSIYVPAMNILIQSTDAPIQAEHDVLIEEKSIVSHPVGSATGLSLRIDYDISTPTLRVLPRSASLYAFPF